MVSVDVKHHVYLLTDEPEQQGQEGGLRRVEGGAMAVESKGGGGVVDKAMDLHKLYYVGPWIRRSASTPILFSCVGYSL